MRRPFSVFSCLALLLLLGGTVPAAPPSDGSPLLLVANKNGNSLSLVNASSWQVEDSVATGRGPHEVAAAPDRRRAYVANYEAGTITVVDVDARRVTTTWPLDGYERPHGIAVGPTEEHVYVTAENAQSVLELDAETGDVLRSFETGKDGTHMLALSSDGTRLYATSIGSGTVSVVDLEVGDVRTHEPTGDGAEGVAVTPNDEEVWISNRADDTLSILDAHDDTVTDSLRVTGFPIRVAFGHEGTRAVVSRPRAGGIAVVDVPSRTVDANLETGAKPIGVLTHPDRPKAYVANSGSKIVSVIDLLDTTVIDTVSVGRGPDGMAFLPIE